MGKGQRSGGESQEHNITSRPKENRGGCTGTVGEGEGGEEVGGIEREEPAVHSLH